MSGRGQHILLALAALLLYGSCREQIQDLPAEDRPPATYLWLTPDGEVGVGVSRQRLHWYGEDPDGLIRGYLFGYGVVQTNVTSAPVPDTLRYTWTTANDTLLRFPLDTLFRRFVVVVRGVDQRFAGLPSGSVVRLAPRPFWDRNDDGYFGGEDALLTGLTEAMDPKGAVLTFPVRNSPPAIGFIQNPLDPTQLLRQPDTTFTAATFAWSASDPDGNNTLVGFRIALNDTSDSSRWLHLSLRDTMVTLVVPRLRSNAAPDLPGTAVTADVYSGSFLGRQYRGQISGLRLDAPNVFHVQAKDVAGEYSRAASLPAAGDRWWVRRPRGRVLLVSDYTEFDSLSAQATYRTALASIAGGAFATIDDLNIGRGVDVTSKNNGKTGVLVPQIVDPALIHTFLLFDNVFWYTDRQPSLAVAQYSLFNYIQNGGRVIFSTSFINTIDPRGALRDFAPIDSVSSVDLSPTRPTVPPPVAGDTRIPAGYVLLPDSSIPASIYPQLAFNATPVNHSVFMRPLFPRADARPIYRLQSDPRNRYIGRPTVAVVDGARTIIFVGLPLHLLNNTSAGNPLGLTAFFTRAFTQEFHPGQVVNRARF